MIYVNEELCTGCGKCAKVCPDGFALINGKAVIKNRSAPCINTAVSACPCNALIPDGNFIRNSGILDKLTGYWKNLNISPERLMTAGRGKGVSRGYGSRGGRRRRGRW